MRRSGWKTRKICTLMSCPWPKMKRSWWRFDGDQVLGGERYCSYDEELLLDELMIWLMDQWYEWRMDVIANRGLMDWITTGPEICSLWQLVSRVISFLCVGIHLLWKVAYRPRKFTEVCIPSSDLSDITGIGWRHERFLFPQVSRHATVRLNSRPFSSLSLYMHIPHLLDSGIATKDSPAIP